MTNVLVNQFSFSKLIGLCLCFFLMTSPIQAQKGSFNYENKFSKKNYYFGIDLGFNMSWVRLDKKQDILDNGAVRSVNSIQKPAFHIGAIANIGLGKNFDLRFVLPTAVFLEKVLEYQMLDNTVVIKKIESVFLEFPILLRYKSKPYNDIRIFVVAGAKYSLDVSSNSQARLAQDMVTTIPHDVAIEFGFGFQLFFPYFILSPEMKFSYGLLDMLGNNGSSTFSNVIDQMFSRGFAISLHFEG